MKRPAASLALAAALGGCGKTDECARLEAMIPRHEEALAVTRGRAAALPQVKARAAQEETRAKALLAETGLDLAEEQLRVALEGRVARLAGARLERTTRPVPGGTAEQGPGGETETVWVVAFEADGLAAARAALMAVSPVPPLFRLRALLTDGARGWKVELARAEVEQVPIRVEPTPPPARPDPAEVPSQLGFCGAGKLRARLAELGAELTRLEAEAAETTVLLPTATSWQGLGLRVLLAREVETETRRLAGALLDAVGAAGLSLRALGVEREVLMLEVAGGQAERGRLERALAPDVLAAVTYPQAPQPGVVRLLVANRVEKERRRPEPGGGEGGSAPFPVPPGFSLPGQAPVAPAAGAAPAAPAPGAGQGEGGR
jgi:hypothetical protein